MRVWTMTTIIIIFFFSFVRSFVHFIRIMTSFQFFLNIKVRVRKNGDVFELRTYA
mgnify:CR=1 FL=1